MGWSPVLNAAEKSDEDKWSLTSVVKGPSGPLSFSKEEVKEVEAACIDYVVQLW